MTDRIEFSDNLLRFLIIKSPAFEKIRSLETLVVEYIIYQKQNLISKETNFHVFSTS
jgi:hypothetical protein